MTDARWPHVRAPFRTAIGVFVACIALIVVVLTPAPVAAHSVQATEGVSAATPIVETGIVKSTLVGFDAGNIISDAVFTNSSTMTQKQIQSFLDGKVSKCREGYTCLKDLTVDTQAKSADKYCEGYKAARGETAAAIISKVAQSCGINPHVLIVMLQKEQGLVTHTWPSDWRYNAAMGQACPDTAPCNVAFAGFFAQVYGAARQMQIYLEGKYFTWYAPGKTWGIRYHPNASCGSKAVTIANKATSALYYYTPYQPNAAALKAGYGTGDACSSYGNRNFYNYFTDWFGPTHTVAGTVAAKLIKHGDPVYLISGMKRYHVQKADYSEFVAAFGKPTTVDSTYVKAFSDGGPATLYLRNASTGDVSFLREGERHRFTSCAMVAAWGSTCELETRLVASDYEDIPAGAEMSWYAKTAYSTSVHEIDGTTLRPVYDAATLKAINGGKTPYAALMPSSVSTTYTSGLTRFVEATFLTAAGKKDVLLPTAGGRLIKLGAWEYAAEFGLPKSVRYRDVPAEALNGYKREGELSLFARCGKKTYAAAGQQLFPVRASALEGFSVPVLDTAVCRKLKRSSAAETARVFVQGAGQNEVYLAEDGVYRHVANRAAMNELTGGVWPRIFPVAAATIKRLPKGDKIVQSGGGTLEAGQFVRSDTSIKVWLPLQGDTKVYLPSWSYAAELGLRQTQKVISSKILDPFKSQGTLGLFVSCAEQTYFASRGKLRPVNIDAAKGFEVTALDKATCAMLTRVDEKPLSTVYVQGIGRDEVYVADGGTFRHVRSRAALERLNGGSWPTVFPLAVATVNFMPKGSPIN